MDPEGTDAHGERADMPRRQKGDQGLRRKTAAISKQGEVNHKRHRRVELRTAMAPGKGRNIQEDPI
jgi:hypothetical protein